MKKASGNPDSSYISLYFQKCHGTDCANDVEI